MLSVLVSMTRSGRVGLSLPFCAHRRRRSEEKPVEDQEKKKRKTIERAQGYKFTQDNFDRLQEWGITNYATVFDLEAQIQVLSSEERSSTQALEEQLTKSQTENKARSHTRSRARAHTLPPRERTRTHTHMHAHAHTHTPHTHTQALAEQLTKLQDEHKARAHT